MPMSMSAGLNSGRFAWEPKMKALKGDLISLMRIALICFFSSGLLIVIMLIVCFGFYNWL